MPVLKPLYIQWVKFIQRFYKKGGFFKSSVCNGDQDGILRDLNFWDYKMNACNNFAIKLGGSDLAIKFNGKLSIGDVDLRENTDLNRVVRRLKILSFLTLNTHVNFYTSPDTLLDIKLNQMSKSSDALPIGFLNFSEHVDLSPLKFTYFDFDTF